MSRLIRIKRLTDWGHQYQDLCDSCHARRLLVLRTERAEHVCARLPQRSHDNDPAIALVVEHRLNKVCRCEDTEEDRKGHSESEVRGILPQSIAGISSDVAMSSGSCVGARAGSAGVDW